MSLETKIKILNILRENAKNECLVSYRDLAKLSGITSAPVIATLTNLLEEIMEEDSQSGRPFLSALVVQKGDKQLPREGFFAKLNELGIVNIEKAGFSRSDWHAREILNLKKYYNND